MKPLGLFTRARIRQKLLTGYLILFVLAGLVGGSIVYVLVRQTVTERIETELSTTTALVLQMVRTAADVSIKNHLRAVAEKNWEIARHYHTLSMIGQMTEDEAKKQATAVLMAQRIGSSGYIYCLDSKGRVVVHPVPGMVGRDVSGFAFVQQQKQSRQGYLEYDWKNPGEDKARPKALYMTWFRPWDWIISASTYREEFLELVNVDDFRAAISSLVLGETGYSFVLDSRGNVVIHPIYSGNMSDARDADGRAYIREICRRKSGRIAYRWRNPSETESREKIAYFGYISEYDWIVVSSGYMDEFFRPVRRVGAIIIVAGVLGLVLFIGFTLWISAGITRPIAGLMGAMERAAAGDLSQRAHTHGGDEVADLSRYFNDFMHKLEASDAELRAEIAERGQAEAALRQSESRYRLLFGSMRSGFALHAIVLDQDGEPVDYRFLEVNPSFERLTGMQAKDLLGRSAREVMPDLETSQVERYGRVALTGESVRFEEYAPFLDRFFEVVAFSPEKGLFATVFQDITDCKRSEMAMRLSRNYVRGIIDSMPSAVMGVDGQGRVTQWNRAAQELTGRSLDEVEGQDLAGLFPEMDECLAEALVAVAEGRSMVLEKVVLHRHGEIRLMDILAYPLAGPQAGGGVIRIDDVSQRVRLEEMMVQTEKMMSVGGLAAGMAHEINNPLGGILQGAQNIVHRLSPDLPANQAAAQAAGLDLEAVRDYMQRRGILRFLEGIQDAGRRAADIVANMLEFSRRSGSCCAPVNLPELLDKALDLAGSDYDLKKQYDFRCIRVVRDFQAGLPLVPCTATEIEQVVLNLLRNAAQAMAQAPNAADPEIRVAAARDKDMVRIMVSDNGPGMSEAVRRRVFEPFFTTKEAGVGLGLGLSVSYFIVTNNHGGTFEVESEPGQGTTFIIKLPF